MSKIGIIGLGVVGSAIYKTLKEKNIDIYGYDKYKDGFTDIKIIYNTNILYIALPTLYDNKERKYDMNAIYDNFEILSRYGYTGTILIKSTIEPGMTNRLKEMYPNLVLVHNPEFLTERNAYEDFKNTKQIILGFPTNFEKNQNIFNDPITFYKKNFENVKITICNSNESEIMKISINSFYSVKIQFFNEIYNLAKFHNSDYNKIKDMMINNGKISPYFMDVPGYDGKLSYGGMCFPKDTNALNQHMIKNNLLNKVLNATIEERNNMRND